MQCIPDFIEKLIVKGKIIFQFVKLLLDIAKAPYNSAFFDDQARVFKGREKMRTMKKFKN